MHVLPVPFPNANFTLNLQCAQSSHTGSGDSKRSSPVTQAVTTAVLSPCSGIRIDPLTGRSGYTRWASIFLRLPQLRFSILSLAVSLTCVHLPCSPNLAYISC